MPYLIALLLLVHGLIHLMGFAKAFGYGKFEALTRDISRPAGLLWLAAAVLLAASAGCLVFHKPWWIWAGGAGILVSQGLIIGSWGDAKFGTIANGVILLCVALILAEDRPGGHKYRFLMAHLQACPSQVTAPPLSEADLKPLPAPVRRYLQRAGVVGKPRVVNMFVQMRGGIRAKQDAGFMPMESEQVSTFEPALRAFYIKARMFGLLPVDGLHLFKDGHAVMNISLLYAFPVADGKGPEMDQSETVTFFNDMCVLAPATLISPSIRWEAASPRSVTAHFSNQGITVTARLDFDENGDLSDFISEDRYQSVDGNKFEKYPWSTPLQDHKEFMGAVAPRSVRLPSRGEARWHRPDGEFAYLKMEITHVDYNSWVQLR